MNERIETFRHPQGSVFRGRYENIDISEVKKVKSHPSYKDFVQVEMENGNNFLVRSSEAYKLNRLDE